MFDFAIAQDRGGLSTYLNDEDLGLKYVVYWRPEPCQVLSRVFSVPQYKMWLPKPRSVYHYDLVRDGQHLPRPASFAGGDHL